MNDKKTPSGEGLFDAAGRASLMGLHMVSGIIVGTLMGYGLDRWLGSYPWCSGVGLVVGVGAGFRNVWLDAKALIRHDERTGASRQENPDAGGVPRSPLAPKGGAGKVQWDKKPWDKNPSDDA